MYHQLSYVLFCLLLNHFSSTCFCILKQYSALGLAGSGLSLSLALCLYASFSVLPLAWSTPVLLWEGWQLPRSSSVLAWNASHSSAIIFAGGTSLRCALYSDCLGHLFTDTYLSLSCLNMAISSLSNLPRHSNCLCYMILVIVWLVLTTAESCLWPTWMPCCCTDSRYCHFRDVIIYPRHFSNFTQPLFVFHYLFIYLYLLHLY